MNDTAVIATGSYTSGEARGQGIRLLAVDPVEATARELGVLGGDVVSDPSFVLWSADGTMLYAVSETAPTRVTAVRVGPSGAELGIAGAVELRGSGGCHLAHGIAPGTLVVAEYGSGDVEVVRLDDDGVPVEVVDACHHAGYIPTREAHPHQVVALPGIQRLAVTDLGLDRVYLYAQRPDGSIDLSGEITMGRRSGPRHVAPDHESRVLYVACENSGEIVDVVRDDDRGEDDAPAWSMRHASPASGRDGANAVSHIEISAHENHAFVANRGPDTLSVHSLGMMRPELVAEIEVGAHPRHFARIDDLLLVAAQEGDRIDVLRWDGRGLEAAGEPLPAPSITCIAPRP